MQYNQTTDEVVDHANERILTNTHAIYDMINATGSALSNYADDDDKVIHQYFNNVPIHPHDIESLEELMDELRRAATRVEKVIYQLKIHYIPDEQQTSNN